MRVLLVEDNSDLAGNLIDYLTLEGASVDYAMDAKQALALVQQSLYDVMVLDVMMPGMDGFQLCQQLRSQHLDVPILFLTARDTLDDKTQGFKAGGDDYLVKPFALPELWLRLNALTRRNLRQQGNLLTVGDLCMNLDTMEVQREEQALQLNPVCWKILRCLMQHSPDVVKRETIEYEIWGEEFPNSDALRTHMYNLRRQVDKPFVDQLVHTVHGVGFAVREP